MKPSYVNVSTARLALLLSLSACGTPDLPGAVEGAGQSRSAVTINGVTAVATFQSLGFSWAPAGGSTSQVATIQFRAVGSTAWRSGMPLWFDARDSSYRGSL